MHHGTVLVNVTVEDVLAILHIMLSEIFRNQDSGVQDPKADIDVCHLLHDVLIELHVRGSCKVGHYDSCFHINVGEIFFDTGLKLAFIAGNEHDIKAIVGKLLAEF